MINYYHKFLQNLSSMLAPLYVLLQKGVAQKWKAEQQKAFMDSKALFQSSDVLVHYNPKLTLIVNCDGSLYGIGAMMSHRMPDGAETDCICL